MFFMMGIMDGRKDIDYNRLITCMACGRCSGIEVYMTYTVLSLFFIPIFKWNRHYYVRTTCCGAIYELDPAIGRRIERGEQVDIQPENTEEDNVAMIKSLDTVRMLLDVLEEMTLGVSII